MPLNYPALLEVLCSKSSCCGSDSQIRQAFMQTILIKSNFKRIETVIEFFVTIWLENYGFYALFSKIKFLNTKKKLSAMYDSIFRPIVAHGLLWFSYLSKTHESRSLILLCSNKYKYPMKRNDTVFQWHLFYLLPLYNLCSLWN